MSRRPLVALIAALAACGGSDGHPDGHIVTGDLLDALRALPGVTADEGAAVHAPAGYRYFIVGLDQPVDHAHPEGARFTQHLSLIVRDPAAPLVLFDSGYWNYQDDHPFELTSLLHGNQLVVEHRFFGASRPASADWTLLTIAQDAADQHAIRETFRDVLSGPWVSTGASKGGMSALFHRRFFPDDVAGTVAYSAPISFGAPDPRYDSWADDTIGTPACRDAVKALAIELVKNRRAMLEQRATAQAAASSGAIAYGRVAIGPAVESAVVFFYWQYWAYYGGTYCASLPSTSASDDVLWQMLAGNADGTGTWGTGVSPPSASSDAELARFEAYQYQAAWQLGFPGPADPFLDPYLMYKGHELDGTRPVGVTLPPYDGGAAMHDVQGWVPGGAAHIIWIYGGWDPWTAGQLDPTGATDATRVTVASGPHGALLTDLTPQDQATTFAMLHAWTGVTPDPTAVPSHLLRSLDPQAIEPPRIPPAVLRGLQLR